MIRGAGAHVRLRYEFVASKLLRKCKNKVFMRTLIIVALCIFWLVLAYREFERGDMLLAGVFLLVGIALTAYRVSKLRG